MKKSDFAIVSPSVIVHEVLYMDIPFLSIKTADNQNDMFSYLKRKGFKVLHKNELKKIKDLF